MDGLRFTAWSRRRLGLALGGAAAALGLAGYEGAAAGKKGKGKRKKRCRKLGASCQPDGKKCCRGNTCAPDDAAFRCCRAVNEPCKVDAQCCPQSACFEGFCKLA
jgi:hypothetical protein